ncbi:hypothetical protein HNQ50_001379 [Silvimonas terrae]|uniref:Uncharacterized protein n=1 Tax=Silvimonas terrae TaxID=300266 RepID=A0A840RCI0_9NEIS|nr:hypothetical protein [Silvimonas terrae]MBB5190657.1 hypothetical protein [Silvimonas terrae]
MTEFHHLYVKSDATFEFSVIVGIEWRHREEREENSAAKNNSQAPDIDEFIFIECLFSVSSIGEITLTDDGSNANGK